MAATRLFVSHSSQDNAWCREVVTALTTAGFDAWYDERGLSGGADWVNVLQSELQTRDVFLLMLTPAALASPWVTEEVRLAIATQRTILPVLHEPTNVTGFLLTRQWIDVIGLPGNLAAQRILTALSAPAVFPAAPTAKSVTFAPQIVPPRMHDLGYIGRVIDGISIITPPLCDVPTGPFTMGSDPHRDPQAGDAEQPQRTVPLGAYRIARYPVTVAEYAYAVTAQALRQPGEWDRQSPRPDHPIVLITWKQAITYSRWVATVTGEPWRVPTEEEWEKAARGADGRIYPWGDRFEPARANTNQGGTGDTTPIGSYPGGVSPYGVWDMAGTVQEWVGIPPDSPLARPGPWGSGTTTDKGSLAGGSFDDSPANARSAYRAQLYVGERASEIGMRLVWQVAG